MYGLGLNLRHCFRKRYEGAYVAHMHYMPVILIISVMILLVISCVIPAVMIGRTSLADMVSGRSEG